MKEQLLWTAKYDQAYNTIPLFSEPYKIKACGHFGNYDGMYESNSVFLKAHGKRYLFKVDNRTRTASLMTVELEDYLRIIDDDFKISPLHNKLFNAHNLAGAVGNDIFRYDDDGFYRIAKELEHEALFGQRLTKKEFMLEFFDKEEIENASFKLEESPKASTLGMPDKIDFDGIIEDLEKNSFIKMDLEEVIKTISKDIKHNLMSRKTTIMNKDEDFER